MQHDLFFSSVCDNEVQSPKYGYEDLLRLSLAPTVSCPISPSFTSTSWHILPRALLSPYLPGFFYFSEIQIRHHLDRQESSILPHICPWHLLKCIISDGTVTVLPLHTETSRAGTASHLCLPPWYLAQCLAHERRI